MIKRVYTEVNNGVYRCGFAGSQEAYDAAYDRLWQCLDWLEERLTAPALPDGRLDHRGRHPAVHDAGPFRRVYHGHFKCNRQKLTELPCAVGLRARPLPDAGVRRHHRLRPDQAALLRRAHRHQPDRDRAPRAGPPDAGRRRTGATRSAGQRGLSLSASPLRCPAGGRAVRNAFGRYRAVTTTETEEAETEQGTQARGHRAGRQRRGGDRVDGPGVLAGRHPGLRRHHRERRRPRGRQGAADHGAGVHPDVLHGGGLRRAQQGRARLRDHLHVGGPGLRAARRLHGRLGDHHRRHHRDGEPGPDRRFLHLRPVRVRQPRGQRLLEHRGRHHLDRGHDLHLLPRARGLGPAAVRPARHRDRHPRSRSRVFAIIKVYTGNAAVGDQAFPGTGCPRAA